MKLFVCAAALFLGSVLSASYLDDAGQAFLRGKNDKGMKLLEKGCEKGEAASCQKIAEIYFNGKYNIQKDDEKAKFFLGKGCELNDAENCYGISGIYFNEKNYEQSNKFLEKACEQKHPAACSTLALAIIKGLGTEINDERAVSLMKQVCEYKDKDACKILGMIYLYGMVGVIKDEKIAFKYYDKACKLNDFESCSAKSQYELSQMKIDRTDYAKEAQTNRAACDKGDAAGCAALGRLHWLGKGVRQDYNKAKELLEFAISKDNISAYYYLAGLYSDSQSGLINLEKAKEYYEKACDEDIMNACSQCGRIYFHGHGVKRDAKIAKEYLGKACDMGDANSCDLYNEMNKHEGIAEFYGY